MRVDLGDISVSFNQAGSGPACVLVHGLAEDHRSWSGVQNDLQGVESFAYDLRGHGNTTVGQAQGNLAQLGEDLIAFLETVTGPAICCGFSLGGTIVLWAAARRPDLVNHAVVIGTSSKVGRAAVGFFQERITQLNTDKPAFAAALRADTKAQLDQPGADLDAIAQQRMQAVGNGAGYINAANAMIEMAANPLTPMLADIIGPVTVIGGAKDAFCPRKAADMICAELANATFLEIPDAGHLMSVDQPKAYSAAIQQAISRRT